MPSFRPVFLASLAFMLALNAQANPTTRVEAGRSDKLAVHSVQLADGRVMERLVSFGQRAGEAYSGEEVPQTPQDWLKRMMDPSRNGLALKHPQLFVEWLDAITEPQFMTALATVALSPEAYAQSLSKLMDPATARNWSEFVDPYLYMQWILAGLDPRFYQSIAHRLGAPDKLRRWLHAAPNDAQPPRGAQGTSLGRSGDARDWQHWMPAAPGANPWLTHRRTYRY